MCRRSPGGTGNTAAATKQPLKGVYAGRMSITPLDPDAICTHESNGDRPDIPWDHSRIQKRPPADLLDAAGAGAVKTQRASRVEAFVTTLIPFDSETVVLAIDGVRDRVAGLHIASGRSESLAVSGSQKTEKPSNDVEGFSSPGN